MGYSVDEIPLGLEYIASHVEPIVDSVMVVDLAKERKSLSQLIDEERPDLLGVTVQTSWHRESVSITRLAKKKGVTTMVGGYHPTCAPDLMLDSPDLDFVVRNEGEKTVYQLASEDDLHKIEGLSFKENGQILHNSDRLPIQNLDLLPFPARHLRRYRYRTMQYSHRIYDAMATSRGCYGRCVFCCEPVMNGGKQRFRSPENVMKEILDVWDLYHHQPLKILFTDPNFLGRTKRDVERVEKLCDMLSEYELDIEFSVMTRTDMVAKNPQPIRRMIEVGINSFEMGIESPSNDLLNNISKGANSHTSKRAVRNILENGGLPQGTFVLGLPDQTADEIKIYPIFAKRLGLVEAAFAFVTPFIGTLFHKNMSSSQRIVEEDLSKYNYLHPLLKNSSLSRYQLIRLLGYCYGNFYSRKKIGERRRLYERNNRPKPVSQDLLELGWFGFKALSHHSITDQLMYILGFLHGKLIAK